MIQAQYFELFCKIFLLFYQLEIKDSFGILKKKKGKIDLNIQKILFGDIEILKRKSLKSKVWESNI